jgi:prophage tail gpP-like protein
MAERDATGRVIRVSMRGHAHEWAGKRALYAPDTMALVEAEEVALRGLYLVTSVQFEHGREEGEVTSLNLVPKGTVLK